MQKSRTFSLRTKWKFRNLKIHSLKKKLKASNTAAKLRTFRATLLRLTLCPVKMLTKCNLVKETLMKGEKWRKVLFLASRKLHH